MTTVLTTRSVSSCLYYILIFCFYNYRSETGLRSSYINNVETVKKRSDVKIIKLFFREYFFSNGKRTQFVRVLKSKIELQKEKRRFETSLS